MDAKGSSFSSAEILLLLQTLCTVFCFFPGDTNFLCGSPEAAAPGTSCHSEAVSRTRPAANVYHAPRAPLSFAVSNSGDKWSETSSGDSPDSQPGCGISPPWGECRSWGERLPLSGHTPTYVVSLLPAAPPPCRQRAGSPLRRWSPFPPCTRCCTPRALRQSLGACSHSSTLLRTPGPRRCKPCGEQNQVLLVPAPHLFPSLYLMKAGACPCVQHTLLPPGSRDAAGPRDQHGLLEAGSHLVPQATAGSGGGQSPPGTACLGPGQSSGGRGGLCLPMWVSERPPCPRS